MSEKEKDLEGYLKMIYICNFNVEYIAKYRKAMEESRAIGKIVDYAYDKKGEFAIEERALYFKTRVEYHKFLYVLNCINSNEPYNYNYLKDVSIQELLDEINLRMNEEMQR